MKKIITTILEYTAETLREQKKILNNIEEENKIKMEEIKNTYEIINEEIEKQEKEDLQKIDFENHKIQLDIENGNYNSLIDSMKSIYSTPVINSVNIDKIKKNVETRMLKKAETD